MSGTPPFCTLGSRYFYDDFNAVDNNKWTYHDATVSNGQLTTLGKIDGWAQAKISPSSTLGPTDYCIVQASYTLENITDNQRGVFITARTSNNMFYWGVYSGVTGSPLYLSGPRLAVMAPNIIFNESNSDPSGHLKIVMTSTDIKFYHNGILKHTIYEKPYVEDFQVFVTNVPSGLKASLSDYFIDCSLFPNGTPCQGEIPSYHRVAPASTVKLAHYRRIAEHRTPQVAEQFHEIIKATI